MKLIKSVCRNACFIVLIIMAGLLAGCKPHTTQITGHSETPKPVAVADEQIKVGGLYAIKDSNRIYIMKVLALDNYAVHIRMYSQTFDTVPTDINSANLQVLIGHSPLDRNGFLSDNPKLIKVEEVKESELEGYRTYIEEMKK